MRVIYPRFMVWSRQGKHALRVELAKMRCKRLGHRHLIGVWDDALQRHVALCIECETRLPDAKLSDIFLEPREIPA